MAYIYDKDLEFLKRCSDKDLEELFNLLVYKPKSNKPRLTSTLLKTEEYKEYKDRYSCYWEKIAQELQLFGGNTIVNRLRKNSGVKYREILNDVARRLKIPVFNFIPVAELENAICERLLMDLFTKMKEKDIEKFFSQLSIHNKEIKTMIGINQDIPWGKLSTVIIREIFKISAPMTYRITSGIATILWRELFGKTLTLTANTAVANIVGGLFSGPVALALNLWILADITGPAMRITIPAVVLISTLRQKYYFEKGEI